jgi:two-component system, OmpR family, phosphate regulon sensor histidine kinase PhoR
VNLTRRLILGAAIVLAALVLAVVAIAGGRLHDRLVREKTSELVRTALLVGSSWTRAADADSLADAAGRALGYRVTLIDPAGTVVGDSEFEREALPRLDNHLARPEIRAAADEGEGMDTRESASAGRPTIYAATRHQQGYVRLGIETAGFEAIVVGARRDVLVAGLFGLLATLVLAGVFAHGVTRPVVELRNVARELAAGDLTVRPSLSAPAEIGDLAAAIHRMAEQLAARLEALREDDALMNALFDTLNEGVLAVDDRGAVVRINDRGRHYLRVTEPVPFPRERLPRNAVLRQALEGAIGGSAAETTELQIGASTYAVSAQPLPGGGAVVTLFDLTPLRRLEAVRRDFVANVSHELKTPLTVIGGFAETLLDPELSTEERRRFAETVLASATRMRRIVDDLLDLSRIESGKWTPELVPLPLVDVVRDALGSIGEDADARGIRLRNLVPPGLTVTADATAMRQVLTNLAANAVRHTLSGTVTVDAEKTEGAEVRIDVSDTGVGIAAEHLPRIFERFYRVDHARSREEGGTGLGLAIVRHLVEAHGGRVGAASVPGEGTTISLWLPDPG